jgi:hypothetical protein
MNRDQMQNLLRQKPFSAFRVYLKDGRSFPIIDPHMNLLGPTFIKIGVFDANDPDPIPDYTEYIPLTLIDRVEMLGNATRTTAH